MSPKESEKIGAVYKDEKQRLLFWSGRKAAFPAIGRISLSAKSRTISRTCRWWSEK